MVQFGQFQFRSNPIRSNPFVAASLRWFICVVQVKAMVQGRDRRPELGYKLALECRRNINYPMKNKNSKYNNMQVNPDGSLAANQTNESNHNTAKPSTAPGK